MADGAASYNEPPLPSGAARRRSESVATRMRDALEHSVQVESKRLRGLRQAYLGQIDGANLIKLHRQSGKVSYLVYPDFDTDPHPALRRSVKLSLRTREIDCLITRTAPTRRSCIARRRFWRAIIRSMTNLPGSRLKKRKTACWTIRAG